MILDHLYLIKIVARSIGVLNNHYDDDDDIISAGKVGLMKALTKHDPKKGKFATYAALVIKGEIFETMSRGHTGYRVPLRYVGAWKKINQLRIRLGQELDREVSDEDLINNEEAQEIALAVSKTTTVEILLQKQRDYSRPMDLDQKINDDEEDSGTLLDTIIDENINFEEETEYKDLLEYLFKNLTDVQKLVINCSFGLNGYDTLTQEQIAEIIGVGHARVGQIKWEVLEIWREKAKTDPNLLVWKTK